MRIPPVSNADVGTSDVKLSWLPWSHFIAIIVEKHAFAIRVELANASGTEEELAIVR